MQKQLRKKNKFADSFWMDVICITELLSELEDDAPTQETSAADEPPKDNKDTVENYICTLEDDFDFDELLQQTLTPSTDELLLEMRDGEKAVQTSGRRAAELKRLERFGWQRVPAVFDISRDAKLRGNSSHSRKNYIWDISQNDWDISHFARRFTIAESLIRCSVVVLRGAHRRRRSLPRTRDD